MNRREQDAHEDLCRRLVTALNERDAARADALRARWSAFGPCDTCGADAGMPCTVGQYGSPSPHASTRSAALPHSRREVTA